MKKWKKRIEAATELFKMWIYFWAAWLVLAVLYKITWTDMQVM
jgi:hypothetical protein